MAETSSLPTCPNRPALSIWRLATSSAKSIVEMHSGVDDRNLYCVHSVTGDVGGLDRFAARFGQHRLQGIQVPKLQMTQHVNSTVEAMAARHVALITEHQPFGPIRLIGWSAGAIIALEMAQQFLASGREVPLLVALDGAPCNTGAGLSRHDPRYALKVLANLPGWVRDDVSSSDWSLSGIRKRLSEKIAACRGARGFADKDTLDASAVESVLARPGWSPAQKAFVQTIYAALSAYHPQPYRGRTLVFETRTQPLLHLRQVGAAWRAVAEHCEIVSIGGNHSGLIHDPTASWIAAEVIKRLD